MEVTLVLLLILFCVAVLAGWIDTLAGGGGLIVLPVLLFVGMPPLAALATNKSQGCVGTFTATFSLFRQGYLRDRSLIKLVLYAAMGAALGTLLIQHINTDFLNWAIPALLISVAIYFAFGNLTPKAKKRRFGDASVAAVGFYDGAVGPGTGSFFAASGVAWRARSLVNATIEAKLFNFTTNIASLVLFAAGGQVVWSIGLTMMLGQAIGAWFASHNIVTLGSKIIRPLVILMCLLLSAQQIWQLF
ncbi:TSUP family transporter [Salinibius halmophilus]|uniref:TSUP family transporter n=1 Tax=Salinibius halmophilus TaxID=1853216 RepID=UPI001F2037C0|nr:TSUP family transporter [Salinibius halmophilus]